jgi:hypothetical protein
MEWWWWLGLRPTVTRLCLKIYSSGLVMLYLV